MKLLKLSGIQLQNELELKSTRTISEVENEFSQ